MSSLLYISLLNFLIFQETYACAKHEDPKVFCDAHSYYFRNCTYDRFGIREQLRLPEGNRQFIDTLKIQKLISVPGSPRLF